MLRKIIIALGIAATTLSSPTLAQQKTDSGFWVDGFQWNRSNGSTLLVFQLINNEGTIAVCGSYFTKGPNRIRRLSNRALGSYLVSTNGAVVVRDLKFLNEVHSEDRLGQDNACKETGVAWFEGANDQVQTRVTRRNF